MASPGCGDPWGAGNLLNWAQDVVAGAEALDVAPLGHPAAGRGAPPLSRRPVRQTCQQCGGDLEGHKRFYKRYHTCETCALASTVEQNGSLSRFCQQVQCGRFHPLDFFNGLMRTCREQLARHAERQRVRRQQKRKPTVAGSDDDEDAFVPPPQAGMLGNGPMGLGPWVMVPPPPPQEVAAAAAQQVPNGADFAQPWGMPDDRLCDVTIRHDALFSAAGHVTVHAGTLTVAFTGCEPEHLLQLLTGSVGGCATAAAGAGALRTLRLSARSLRFDALPAKAGSDGGQQAGTATPQQSQQQARRGYSGAEVRDFILATEWSALWEAKLQRSMFRDQETLLLTRRPPPAEPADAAASPPPVAGMAAPAPGTH